MVRETILEKLNEIEKRENIKILHCIESGSRAWGFASPDSDYDVRFIYVRPKEFYLRLDKTRDVIEWQLDDTLDINGWDVQKALTLLHKSNPTLFEWNSSPVVYKTTDEWQKISAIINRYFVAKSGLYHYISTAKSNYREYLKSRRRPRRLPHRQSRIHLPRRCVTGTVLRRERQPRGCEGRVWREQDVYFLWQAGV